jgi:hypothetical protein
MVQQIDTGDEPEEFAALDDKGDMVLLEDRQQIGQRPIDLDTSGVGSRRWNRLAYFRAGVTARSNPDSSMMPTLAPSSTGNWEIS